jgi:hypothetical protein
MIDLHFWLLVGFIALPGKWCALFCFCRWLLFPAQRGRVDADETICGILGSQIEWVRRTVVATLKQRRRP